mmetsp:Transcript_41995/g.91486  ORF Transcript_41995/g.91486 Transcript_41995/m.91486 type:complete len:226 (-) Transcript_41995:2672-3349(-)
MLRHSVHGHLRQNRETGCKPSEILVVWRDLVLIVHCCGHWCGQDHLGPGAPPVGRGGAHPATGVLGLPGNGKVHFRSCGDREISWLALRVLRVGEHQRIARTTSIRCASCSDPLLLDPLDVAVLSSAHANRRGGVVDTKPTAASMVLGIVLGDTHLGRLKRNSIHESSQRLGLANSVNDSAASPTNIATPPSTSSDIPGALIAGRRKLRLPSAEINLMVIPLTIA